MPPRGCARNCWRDVRRLGLRRVRGAPHKTLRHAPAQVPGKARHADSDDRRGVRGPGVGGLLCRLRPRRDVRRQGRRQDRGPAAGRDADLRAGPRRAGRQERARGAAAVHHQPGTGGSCRGRHLHRGRHAVAARRRACRSLLRVPGGARDRRPPRRLQGDRDQVDGARRHRRRGGAHPLPRRGRMRPSPSYRTRSSCARARPSATSSAPTASSSARTTSARAR